MVVAARAVRERDVPERPVVFCMGVTAARPDTPLAAESERVAVFREMTLAVAALRDETDRFWDSDFVRVALRDGVFVVAEFRVAATASKLLMHISIPNKAIQNFLIPFCLYKQ